MFVCVHSRVGHVALPYNLLRLNLRLFDFARLEKLLDLTPKNIHLAALLVAQQTEPVDRCADVVVRRGNSSSSQHQCKS